MLGLVTGKSGLDNEPASKFAAISRAKIKDGGDIKLAARLLSPHRVSSRGRAPRKIGLPSLFILRSAPCNLFDDYHSTASSPIHGKSISTGEMCNFFININTTLIRESVVECELSVEYE